MTTIYTPGQTNEKLVGNGQFNTAVTAAQIAAGAVSIKKAPGRLCRVLITTTTTASQAVTIYDNTTGSGTVIATIPGGTAVGSIFDFEMPAQIAITIGQNASLASGAVTVSWV